MRCKMARSLYPCHQAARTRCSSIPLVVFLRKFSHIPGRASAPMARSGDRPQRVASEEERGTVVRLGAVPVGAERSEEKNSFERG